MKKTTAILSGENAFDLIENPIFLEQWFDLYRACPWSTVYQSADFVKTWYEIYGEQFIPVILAMTGAENQLHGLLTLATNRLTGRLVYAGDVLSEYQVWLASDDAKDAFILEALEIIGREFPRQALRLKFLPPRTHVKPVEKRRGLRNACGLTASLRPLIRPTDEPRIDHSLKSKKIKLNRLKRMGPVIFEKVASDEFPEIFEQAWPLYEFRQIEHFNLSPFLTDVDLKRFVLALAKRSDVLHMTVLKVDQTIVAWLLGTQSNGFLHLLATGYSPFHARHSPAMLHMLMLAKSLIQEQRIFDLTPGGDKYKDQLATAYEQTHTLHFYPSLKAAIDDQQTRALANKAAKKIIRVAIQDPARALMASFCKGRRDRGLAASSQPMETECRFRVFKLGAFDLHKSCECLNEVSKNKVIDLLRYESTPSRSRRDFVSQAWRFIDQGADVYTLVRDARLIACCWIVAGTRMASPESSNLGVPAGTALLLRFYAHAEQDRAKLLKVLLKKWASELASPTDTIGLSIAISESGLFETIESTDDDTRSPSAIALNGCPEIL